MERLILALEETDARTRAVARELLDASLDLHGLALARLLTVVGRETDGAALVERLARDDYVEAVLLLHGLHPDAPEARLRRRIESAAAQWEARGWRVVLLDVEGVTARLRVEFIDARCDGIAARREIEAALTEAAPDLDRIAIEEAARDASATSAAA
jgi:hypothetical protein